MRIIFMGTPDFAVPCLQSLMDAGHSVCAVFTQPDKPKGRGYAMTPPPVKVLAQKHGIPVFQPGTLRTPQAAEQISGFHPDLIAVVAYGKILPKEILDIPPHGCINVHASLLPKYRGAAPIQWSVINGEPVTGVTTMYMDEGLDTGDILFQQEVEIGPDETSGMLFDRLSVVGAELLVRTLDAVHTGNIERVKQGKDGESNAPMLKKEMSRIDWNKPAAQIHNLVRGLSPWPVAYAAYQGRRLKIHKTRVYEGKSGAPGELSAGKDAVVCCGGGTALQLLEVQYEGGRKMDAADFFRGHPSLEKTILG